jgi:hypothetical protein
MNYTTILINTVIHIILVLIFEGVFLFVILYPILSHIVKKKTDNFTWQILNKIWPTIDWSSCYTSNTNPKDLTPYYITPELYKFIKMTQIDEQNYMASTTKYPYLVYAIIMSILVILLSIIIIFSRYMNIYVNYKYIIINSFIIFLLICAIAATILWFDVFNQDYKININKPFLKKYLEEYKSL